MSPEFASGRLNKDGHTTDRRHRNYQTSPARTDDRCAADNNRNVVRRDKLDSSRRRSAHLEDHEPHCNLRHKKYCSDDADRKSRTERYRSPVSDYRHTEPRASGNRTSRSRSPGYQKVFCVSDDYRHREERNDSLRRRYDSNLGSQGNTSRERSAYKNQSSDSRSSAYTQSTRPSECDRHVDIDNRHSTNEPDSRKYKEMSRSNNEKEYWTKSSHSDDRSTSDRRTCGSRTSRRHCDNSSPTRRQYSSSNRRSHAELREDIRCSHDHSSRYCDSSKASYRRSSAFPDCRCPDSGDHHQPRTDFVRDRHDDRTDCHNAASPAYSRNELNSTSHRDRRDEDGKSRSTERRRSSPCDKYTSTEDRRVSTRKECMGSGGRQSATRDDRRRSEIRSVDKANLTFEESSSSERKLVKRCHDTASSRVGMEKSGAVIGDRTSDGRTSSCCSSSKEELNNFHGHEAYFSHADHSIVKPASDADETRYPVVTSQMDISCLRTCGKSDAFSSDCRYCVARSWSAAYLGSVAQPVIQSGQQWVDSGDSVTGIQPLQPQWHESARMIHHTSTDNTKHHDLPQIAAVSQLPRLSTRISTLSTNIDPRKLGSAVSLNSNINLSALPSNTSFSLTASQAAAEGQYMMDNGESPLLDEPCYYSPVAVHDPSLNLVGSSISSLDHIRPGLIPTRSRDNMELKNLLDVVTIAKTTLEQTLPPGCQIDPLSKHQKLANMERVADEVKSALKPFFVRSEIDKEEYKDIMRKAVPKILSSKAGVDTKRIREFIASYVGKVKSAQKRAVAAKQHVIEQQLSADVTAAVDSLAATVDI